MDLEALRRFRRLTSALVAISAIALVMARVQGSSPEANGEAIGKLASVVFLVSLVLFIGFWRKEHVATQTASAERERQQLAALRLQVELARRKAQKEQAEAKPAPASAADPVGVPKLSE